MNESFNISTPAIIKETSRGYEAVRILDKMFSDRQINCVTQIDEDSCNSLIMQLLTLEQEAPDEEITVFINSPGGSVMNGLALYDVMQAISCPIRTVCIGMAASMGSIIFAAGDKREMLPHSKLMIHDPLITETGGSAMALKTISDNLMKTRQITAEILSKHSNKTVEEILEMTAKDTYITAEEALEMGFADSIINKL